MKEILLLSLLLILIITGFHIWLIHFNPKTTDINATKSFKNKSVGANAGIIKEQ